MSEPNFTWRQRGADIPHPEDDDEALNQGRIWREPEDDEEDIGGSFLLMLVLTLVFWALIVFWVAI